MSKLVKIAVILAVAVVAIAAKQFTSPGTDKVAVASTASVSPAELHKSVGPLPELKIENLF
jgi:hypothetical protein